MLIYEKENKLNINFDNSTEAEPDVVISKEDGQVNIEAGGEPVGGGSAILHLTFTKDRTTKVISCSKTIAEIKSAYDNNTPVDAIYQGSMYYFGSVPASTSCQFVHISGTGTPGSLTPVIKQLSGSVGETGDIWSES